MGSGDEVEGQGGGLEGVASLVEAAGGGVPPLAARPAALVGAACGALSSHAAPTAAHVIRDGVLASRGGTCLSLVEGECRRRRTCSDWQGGGRTGKWAVLRGSGGWMSGSTDGERTHEDGLAVVERELA